MTEKRTHFAPVIVWFRFDLRLHDHAGIRAALESGRPILPLYIWDENPATRPLGAASKWWLNRSLEALNQDLQKHGSRLILERGNARIILTSMAKEYGIKTIYCSQTFDPKNEHNDWEMADELAAAGIKLYRLNNTLLVPPGTLYTQGGKPFRVFTPFYKSLLASGACYIDTLPDLPAKPWPQPTKWPKSLKISALGFQPALTPSGRDWSSNFDRFKPGEAGARSALKHFLKNSLQTYESDRDRPDLDVTSHLSPHLRFGEISPQRILHEIAQATQTDHRLTTGAAKFHAELAWREFSYGLLAQQPRLHVANFRRDFDHFEWRHDDAQFRAWCRGETGYELVDAGMRELWQTGYMHNRVRMVAASFLVKHLLIDWRRGEQWFWDCLLDADPANNPASWQWVAGCGADAAPYFRVFNPITQAAKFDPKGLYRSRYIQGYTHSPTDAGHTKKQAELFESTDTFLKYPQPVVDHVFARDRALQAYKNRMADEEYE
ncbi:deoxyribodipyrimidine photo-lyase [Asticcacaulis sp.]|uniref:cryptochrome/photolyase family protein n=1 Tax=Asticcacaulis sp. TaxID=1872648 RepID=UPI002C08CE5A|nr:deoxyribodipyrimidine photo-lyase [Asticcacaulis sp.]HTM82365.1 deoxyribodipyrimidine photo-lyase [Asticcacaulis sp.]